MASQIFSVVNLLALLGWVALAAVPRRNWAHIFSASVLPAVFGALYVVIIAATFWRSPGGFSSLTEVGRLFRDPWLLLAGWLHYLAFDLFVGSWIVRDARERGVAHYLLLPCLALTFMFGPAGWLSYRLLRAARRSQPSVARA
jgi:hypothetical protein